MKEKMDQNKWIISLFLLFGLFFIYHTSFAGAPLPRPGAYVLNLAGTIGPATQDYVARGIDQATKDKASLVILLLDTPGGLEKSMRLIINKIIHSPLPIVTYVAPSGARAASAGTFILYASHIAAMAPGTNVGAATPIALTTPDKSSKNATLSNAEKKAINDATASIRSLAQMRKRNVEWAEQAVRGGDSISAMEALSLNVIDFIANDIPDLLRKINGKIVTIENKTVAINTANINLKTLLPDWRIRFLAIITDPNIAYILLLIGIYGLIFEFMNPGFILPGVAGLISLLIALYAFQLLPINYVGLGLILLGMAFIFAEAFVPSFGALGVGGLIAFIVGSIMLFDSHTPGFTLLIPVIIGVALVTAGILVLITQFALRAHKRPIVSGREELIGSEGSVIIVPGDEDRPLVRIRGELWQIRSQTPLKAGERVRVEGIEELVLIVTPIKETKEGNSA